MLYIKRPLPNASHAASRHAYSLIEIAIVLLVIGLIIGVLFGSRQLFEGARVKATLSEAEQYASAIDHFTLRYGYLPGDLPNPDTHFTQSAGYAITGDGNGKVDNVFERELFWFQLSQSGLIDAPLSPAASPQSTLRVLGVHRPASNLKIAGWSYVDQDMRIHPCGGRHGYQHVLRLGGVDILANNGSEMLPAPVIPVSMHHALDQQIDGGDGPVRGLYQVDKNSACITGDSQFHFADPEPHCVGLFFLGTGKLYALDSTGYAC